jgi:hypothetical protein
MGRGAPNAQRIISSHVRNPKIEAERKLIMKELVVGQKARMRSGSLFVEVTVTEITEKWIEVQPVSLGENERPWMMRFDKNGKIPPPLGTEEWRGFGQYDWYPAFGGWWQEHFGLPVTEFGPWELVESPKPPQSNPTLSLRV